MWIRLRAHEFDYFLLFAEGIGCIRNFQLQVFLVEEEMECAFEHQIISQIPAIDECIITEVSQEYGYCHNYKHA